MLRTSAPLRVVADDHHVVMRAGEATHDVGLQDVRVLVLVDHDVAVLVTEALGELDVGERVAQLHEEIVVVDELAARLELDVAPMQRDDRIELLVEMRVLVGDEIDDRRLLVDRHAEELGERLLTRKALLLAVETGLGAQQIDDVLAVAAVEDREPGVEADRAAVPPQCQVRERVERAACDLRTAAADEPGRAAQHLFRGLAGERQEQDRARRHARLDEARDPIDERPRLAAARAGDDEHRAVERRRGLELLRVQLLRVGDAELRPFAPRIGTERVAFHDGVTLRGRSPDCNALRATRVRRHYVRRGCEERSVGA